MKTQSYEAALGRASAPRKQAAPAGETAVPRGRGQRPGLRAVAARWPHLSPGQVRQLHDLVYRRTPEQLCPPVPAGGAGPLGRGAPCSRVACGFPLLWAVWAEQHYARRDVGRRAAAPAA
jgi:hypothetical protein